jgi:hypothetical protein
MDNSELLAILYQALGSPHGLVIETSNWNLARQRFYKARSDAGDPALQGLEIRRSPEHPDTELLILHAKKATEHRQTDGAKASLAVRRGLGETGSPVRLDDRDQHGSPRNDPSRIKLD